MKREVEESPGQVPEPRIRIPASTSWKEPSRHLLDPQGERRLAAPTLPAPGPRPSLRTNIAWSFGGALANALCNWLGLLVIARLGKPSDVGTYALAGAICTPIFMLTNLQLRGLQATDAQGRFSFSTFWSVRAWSSLLAIIGLAAFSIVVLDDALLQAVVITIAATKGFQSMSDIAHGLLQRYEQMDWIARSTTLRGVLTLILLGGTYYLTKNLVVASLTVGAANLMVLVAVDVPRVARLLSAKNRSRFQIRPKLKLPNSELMPMLASALPLGATMLIASSTIHLPSYLLEAYATRSDVGLFAAASQLVSAGTLAIGAIGQATSPRLAGYAASGSGRQFRKLYRKVVSLAAGVALLGTSIALLFGKQILLAVFSPSYLIAWKALVVLSVAAVFGFAASISGYALTAIGAHAIQLPLYGAVFLLSLLAGHILVPALGLLGAACSVLMGNAFCFAASTAMVIRRARSIE